MNKRISSLFFALHFPTASIKRKKMVQEKVLSIGGERTSGSDVRNQNGRFVFMCCLLRSKLLHERKREQTYIHTDSGMFGSGSGQWVEEEGSGSGWVDWKEGVCSWRGCILNSSS